MYSADGEGLAVSGWAGSLRQPLLALQCWIIVCVAAGLALSAVLYCLSFGLPVVGFGWHPVDQSGDALRIVAILAPGLLAFSPLLAPSMRSLARTCQHVRDYRRKVALTLAIWWCLPVLTWEYSTTLQLGGLAVVPGHTFAAAALPFVAGLVAILSIAGLVWEPPSTACPAKRAWARVAWVVYALFTVPMLLALQLPSGWPP
ncbi:MAG: hypothetical protein JWO59_1717 [Chloroflexi bacterium]|nr:hypothetical protein [Chloroflexota bacterium]